MRDARMAREAIPEIAIHGDVEARIEPAHRSVELAPPEHRWLRNVVVRVAEHEAIERDLLLWAQKLARLVDPERIAIHGRDLRVLFEEFADRLQGTRQHQVIRAQPAHDFAVRTGESLDERV